jgi:hypothetical protein
MSDRRGEAEVVEAWMALMAGGDIKFVEAWRCTMQSAGRMTAA